MIKKVGQLILIAILLLIPLNPAIVRAADGLQVLESRVEVDFPMKVNFVMLRLSARCPSSLNRRKWSMRSGAGI